MTNTLEIRKVLEIIDGGHEIEGLVAFSIPYPRILKYIRFLLRSRLIEMDNDMLWLTATGQAELAKPPVVRSASARIPDRTDITRVPPLDLGAVHIPKTVVE